MDLIFMLEVVVLIGTFIQKKFMLPDLQFLELIIFGKSF